MYIKNKSNTLIKAPDFRNFDCQLLTIFHEEIDEFPVDDGCLLRYHLNVI